MIWGTNEVFIFVIIVLSFLAAMEAGFRLGRRRAALHTPEMMPHFDALQASLLGLLALLLGFTFAMAVQRFDIRKELVLQEATIIGDAHDLASFLPQPERADFEKGLRTYLQARIDFYRISRDSAMFAAADHATESANRHLWDMTVAAAGKSPQSLPLGQLVAKMNDIGDLNERGKAARENHVPETVLHLLFVVSLTGLGFIAFGYGLNGRRRHISTAFFAGILALTLVTILDIDRPHRGFIQIGEASLLRLQTTLGAAE